MHHLANDRRLNLRRRSPQSMYWYCCQISRRYTALLYPTMPHSAPTGLTDEGPWRRQRQRGRRMWSTVVRQTHGVFQCRRSTDSHCYLFISKSWTTTVAAAIRSRRPVGERSARLAPCDALGATNWLFDELVIPRACSRPSASSTTQPRIADTHSTLDIRNH